MRKVRTLSRMSGTDQAPPPPIAPDSDAAFAVALYRYSRWPDLKARYHTAFEFDPERMRQPADNRVRHGED